MIEILSLIILFWIPGMFVIWRNVFWDLYEWQIKEYRVDRMKSHLLSQEESKSQSRIIYSIKIASIIILAAYLFFPSLYILLIPIPIVFVLYSIEAMLTIESTIGGRLIRPKVSIRNIGIISAVMVTTLIPFIVILYPTAIIYDISQNEQIIENNENIGLIEAIPEILPNEEDRTVESEGESTVENVIVFPAATLILMFSTILILILDITTPLIVSFWVVITEPLSQIRRVMLIKKAQVRISKNKKLKIIGITGSFGKTTTKEILYQILKSKYNTSKTPKNYNSAVGVAIAANAYVTPDTEVFIAEMGAYTEKEVKKATEVAKPDISIVTGVDYQHVSLFGSIEKIMTAKFEIIENAKEHAVAILNGDNEFSLRMAGMTNKKTRVYFTTMNSKKLTMTEKTVKKGKLNLEKNNCIFAEDIKRGKQGIEFKVVVGDEKYPVETNIRGLHFASNFLAAIIAAEEVGMKIKDIIDVINETNFEVPYMNTMNGLNDTTILDDGYNANSTGFLAAIDEMDSVSPEKKSRKIILTKGIIELGWEKSKIYKKIATKIVKKTHGIVTSDKDLRDNIKIIDPTFDVYMAKSPAEFIKGYNKLTVPGDVVLIEGTMNPKVLNELIDKN